jgi:hypothetical protein
MPASAISHLPVASRGSRSAGTTSRSAWDPPGFGGGTANAATISAAAATEAAENAGPVPTWMAAQPTAGPKSAPTTAAPNAVPSSSPRFSSGALTESQARPADHVQALPTPWMKRAASSTDAVCVQPKASVAALIRPSPSSATRRSPIRATSIPPGSDPTSVPAG